MDVYPRPLCIFNNGFDAKALRRIFSSSGLPKSIYEMVVGLQPTLVNSYSRRYFLSADQKFRITLDYNIKYRNIKKNRNNFDQRPQQETTNVVELKYSSARRSKGTGYFKRVSVSIK